MTIKWHSLAAVNCSIIATIGIWVIGPSFTHAQDGPRKDRVYVDEDYDVETPVYEDQERKVCCKPAGCKTIPIPAEYKDETERVCVCPARTVWKKIPCEPGELGQGEKQGDCWQLQEIPAQYKEVTRRVCTGATCGSRE